MVKLKGYPLLNNIKLLYFIFILAIINIGGFMYIRDNQSIFLFAVISLIIYFFNKNMIVVLLSTMIIVNTLIFLNKLNGPMEGYTNKKEKEEEKEEEEEENEKEGLENEEDDAKEGLENVVGELSEIMDETGSKDIKEKLKQIIPMLKTNYDTLSLDINNINKHINKLTSISE
jgi:hypothetical protein